MLVSGFGMQLHAAVSVDGRDRKRLERVCRYLLRPPFALGAVQRTTDGEVRIHFKKPSRSGATYAQMSPERFLARLCALVPPPGVHTVRYYGVLAPRHALRARIVPTREATNIEPKQLSLFVPHGQLELAAITKPALDKQLLDVAPRRLSWMSLLARVFRIDVSVCQRCRGPMRVLRAVTSPADLANPSSLLSSSAPPLAPVGTARVACHSSPAICADAAARFSQVVSLKRRQGIRTNYLPVLDELPVLALGQPAVVLAQPGQPALVPGHPAELVGHPAELVGHPPVVPFSPTQHAGASSLQAYDSVPS